MSQIQDRFISNDLDGYGNYNYGGYNNDDVSSYSTRDYDGGYGGNHVQQAGYRGHRYVPHHRPILIIQPPAQSQPQQDPLLDSLTSLIPLAYLLPLALLAAASPSTTVVGGRKKRHVAGINVMSFKYFIKIFDGIPDNYEQINDKWRLVLSRLTLTSQCPERLACLGSNTLGHVMEDKSTWGHVAWYLINSLLTKVTMSSQRTNSITSAGKLGQIFPKQYCLRFKCDLWNILYLLCFVLICSPYLRFLLCCYYWQCDLSLFY